MQLLNEIKVDSIATITCVTIYSNIGQNQREKDIGK